MKDINLKIRIIIIPFFIMVLVTILGYTSLRWLLDIKLGIIPLKEEIYDVILPALIPWIPVFFWMDKRLQILDSKKEMYCDILMGIILSACLFLSQAYITKASYDLTLLHSPSEFSNFSKEKYFKFNQININRSKCNSFVSSKVKGQYNEDLDFYLFFACPIEETDPPIFYGKKYSERIDNDLTQSQKEIEYNKFIKASQSNFEQLNFQEAAYFEQEGYTDDWDSFVEAILKINPNLDKENQIVLVPQNESFEYRIEGYLKWILIWLGVGFTILFLMIARLPIHQKGLAAYHNNQYLEENDESLFKFLFDLIKPNKGLAFLLITNFIIFLIMVFSGSNPVEPATRELFNFGGVTQSSFQQGEYWRLLSSMFVHSGISHLVSNVVTLLFASLLLEPVLKPFKLLTIYLLCGLIAAFASIYWAISPNTVFIGASGAISGLYGLILIFNLLKIFDESTTGMIWALLGTVIFLDIFSALFINNIGNVAHLSGFLAGFVLGFFLILFQGNALRKIAADKND